MVQWHELLLFASQIPGKKFIENGFCGMVYQRKGWWVGEFAPGNSPQRSDAEIFKNEAQAIAWCERKWLLEQVVWGD